MRYNVKVYLNETPGSRFDHYEPTATFREVPDVFAFDGDEGIEDGVLNAMWAVGNRMDADHIGHRYPGTSRSLSVGDVIVIGEQAFAVASTGFDRVEVPKATPRRRGWGGSL